MVAKSINIPIRVITEYVGWGNTSELPAGLGAPQACQSDSKRAGISKDGFPKTAWGRPKTP